MGFSLQMKLTPSKKKGWCNPCMFVCVAVLFSVAGMLNVVMNTSPITPSSSVYYYIPSLKDFYRLTMQV